MQPPFVPQFDDCITFKRPVPHEWVESTVQTTAGVSNAQFLGTTMKSGKIRLLFYCMVASLFFMLVRSASVQLVSGTNFVLLAKRNTIRSETISARRGIMVDRNGEPLVQNMPVFSVHVNPPELPRDRKEREKAIEKIGHVVGREREDIQKQIDSHYSAEPLVVSDAIEYPAALSVIVGLSGLPGVEVVLRDARHYSNDTALSLSHVLGYMGRISEEEYVKANGLYASQTMLGKQGIEYEYEKELRGRDGVKRIAVDALGAARRIISEETPVYGKSLILTLDKKLQEKSETALKKAFEQFHATKGVVIVSQPATGEILSLVSLPAYDDNLFSKGISQQAYQELIDNPSKPLFNRSVLGEYPSGSTIKPVVAAAGLADGIITPQTTFSSTGGIRVGQWFFPDWKSGGHGVTNLAKALAESVNTYFYMVGGGYGDVRGLGPDRLLHYFSLFGFGEKTGVDFPGERSGFVPSREWKKEATGEPWYIGDTYHIAIGQGDILVTPLQIHQSTSYFANDGWSIRPHLVKGIKGVEGVEESHREVVKKDIIEKKYTTAVREGLRKGVLEGSSRRLSLLPVTAAGKTGTAQWSTQKQPHAWFTGWAPFENPELAVTVLIEEGQEGSSSAVGVASEIMQWYFRDRKKESVRD